MMEKNFRASRNCYPHENGNVKGKNASLGALISQCLIDDAFCQAVRLFLEALNQEVSSATCWFFVWLSEKLTSRLASIFESFSFFFF